MTPNFLQPMPWLQMDQQQQMPSVGQGIAQGVGALGQAWLNRKRQQQAQTSIGPNYEQAPAYQPMPEHEMGHSQENPLRQRRNGIINMLMSGGGY